MSDKPVAERLQVKGGRRLAVLGAPPGMDGTVGAQEARADVGAAEIVLLVAPDRATLRAELPAVLGKALPSCILWVAYPKLTSRLAGDLNRDVIHTMAPEFGLDPVAQIAIDADWSALRLKRIE